MESFSKEIGEVLTIAVKSKCPEILIVLLKLMYQECCLDNSNKTKDRIKKIFHGDNEESNNLFTKIIKSEKLVPTRSLMISLGLEISENIEDFENYLKAQLVSQKQLLYDATRIMKKYATLRKDGYDFAKIISMCPTHLHWMALYNDTKSVEVNTIDSV